VQRAEQAPASDHLTFTGWAAGVVARWRTVFAVAAGAV